MTYEYRCKECDTVFDVKATIEEKEEGLHPECPSCGSTETGQMFGAVGILGASHKDPGPMMGPGCGPGMGAGCC